MHYLCKKWHFGKWLITRTKSPRSQQQLQCLWIDYMFAIAIELAGSEGFDVRLRYLFFQFGIRDCFGCMLLTTFILKVVLESKMHDKCSFKLFFSDSFVQQQHSILIRESCCLFCEYHTPTPGSSEQTSDEKIFRFSCIYGKKTYPELCFWLCMMPYRTSMYN